MTIKDFDINKAKILEYMFIANKQFWVDEGVKNIIKIQNGIAFIDPYAKEIFLTMILTGLYFGCKHTENVVEGKTTTTFTESDYDSVHSEGILHKIEHSRHFKDKDGRLTGLAKSVRKAMDDFALFTKMLNVVLSNELSVRNNFADRLADCIANDLDPENWNKALMQIKDIIAPEILEQVKEI